MAGGQTCKVGLTLAPLARCPYGYRFFRKHKTVHKNLVYNVKNNMAAKINRKKIDLTRIRPRVPRHAARYRTANPSLDVSVMIYSI
jgi:hypothetical protein